MMIQLTSKMKVVIFSLLSLLILILAIRALMNEYLKNDPMDAMSLALSVCVESEINYHDSVRFSVSPLANEKCRLVISPLLPSPAKSASCELNQAEVKAIVAFFENLKGTHSTAVIADRIPFQFRFESGFNQVSSPFDQILPQCKYLND